MRALRQTDPLVLVDAPEPEPARGEAIVRVRLAGVCSTDLELLRGYAGFTGILGHELVGEVVICEDARWIGARVVAEINATCGSCEACLGGRRSHCVARTVVGIRGRDGAFAERVRVPIANLHRVPDHAADEQAVFTEPLAAAMRILEQVAVAPGERVAVVGDGKLGLLVARVLARHGAEVTVVGRHARKLAIAEQFGARVAAPGELAAKSVPFVVEATGNAAGLAHALALVRPAGTLVLKSTIADHGSVATTGVVVDEITIVGSRCGPFAPALAALADGSIDPRPLVDHIVPLADAPRAIELARTPGTLKVLLDMRSGA
jgi:threonine dehydrogenase-like Zn-dependent dehydrogenase